MKQKRLNEIRKIRLEKVKKLRKLGIDPYPAKLPAKPQAIFGARKREGKEVVVAGRIWGWRAHGDSIFADIKDESGKIQAFFQKKNLGKNYSHLELYDIGDFIWAKGKVFKTKAGEITVDVAKFQLITKSIRPLPSTWYGLKDVEERYRRRYVDLLLNEDIRAVFEKKARIVRLLREYFDEHGFLEVKTPALQPLYGGASAKPFITRHNALDIDLYLRISDELYLKRLIVGGYEKVYELCTDFRNEGIARWHNPEFTMLEFYWAYADYEDLMKLTEEMLSEIARKIGGSYQTKYLDMEVDFKPPWKRLSYHDAFVRWVGIDTDKKVTKGKLLEAVKTKKLKVDFKDAPDIPSMLDEIYKVAIRPNIVNPTFLVDYPYHMRPLAKRHRDDETKAENFQLVVAKTELINAYSELNDPQDQKARWKEDVKRVKAGVKDAQVVDEDYIMALEYGMPPTAGWGLGVDRFVAILTNQQSIKDTILFPTLRPEK